MSTPTQPVVLYHLVNSRAQRILWLLEELEIPYEYVEINRLESGAAPPAFYEIHPLGKSPVIKDGDLVLPESGAIVEYLLKKYGNGRYEPTPEGWVDNTYFSHYAEASLQAVLVRLRILNGLVAADPASEPILRKERNNVIEELKRQGQFIEEHLAKRGDWFAGGDHLTSADFMMAFSLEVFISRLPEHVGPLSRAYVKRIEARPAYVRSLAKVGNYVFALPKDSA